MNAGAVNDFSYPDNKSEISHFSKISVKKDALNNLKDQQDQDILEVPPNMDSRKFNECDIIGNLERDEKGNVIVGDEIDKTS